MKQRQIIRFLDQIKRREKRIIIPIEVGIPPLVINKKNVHPTILADSKELALKILKYKFSKMHGFVLIGRPKYKITEGEDGNTYIAIKHLAYEV